MKVVYNSKYGGFSLSEAAIKMARNLSGDPNWGGSWGGAREVPRADKFLVAVVEALGAGADGSCAALAIEEVPSGAMWRIDEYDGLESVMTVDDYEWSVAE